MRQHDTERAAQDRYRVVGAAIFDEAESHVRVPAKIASRSAEWRRAPDTPSEGDATPIVGEKLKKRPARTDSTCTLSEAFRTYATASIEYSIDISINKFPP